MENIAIVLIIVVFYVAFPIWAAYYASRKGRRGWAGVSIGSIFLGLGAFGGLFALLAARRPIEQPESQQATNAERIRTKGRVLGIVAGIGTTLVIAVVMIVAIVVPMSDAALQQSLSNPHTSATEAIEEMDSAGRSGSTITGLVSVGLGILVNYLVRDFFNKRADKATKEATYSDSKQPVSRKRKGSKSYTEKDNMGTRQDTLSLANSYWMSRISSTKKDPFALYTFDTEKEAREALLALPCIHAAEDSQKLICTEVLVFGYYPTPEGNYEAIICGDELTQELWAQARRSFSNHGGHQKNELEPAKRTAPNTKTRVAQPDQVVFVREDREQRMGVPMIYRIHRGPDAASARAFLEQNPVTKQFHYTVVETPEGNYCRDIQGIYKE